MLTVPLVSNTDNYPILREEDKAAVKSLKKGKSPGIDNIPGELVQAGGDAVIGDLCKICNKIWQTGEWPILWTQSLIITIPKKGNLQQCKNYHTISLICHPSKVLLKVLLNRLKPQAESIISEEQAGSDQVAVRQNRSLILGYCTRRASNINKTSITSLLILKRRLTEYGIKPFGLL